VRRDLQRSSRPSLCLEQIPLDHVAQGHIESLPEHLPGWTLHSLAGKRIPFLLISSSLLLNQISSCSASWALPETTSTFSVSSKKGVVESKVYSETSTHEEGQVDFSQPLLACHVCQPHNRLGVLSWTPFSMLISFLDQEAPVWMQ